jgi:hypothetical protein
LKQKSEQEKLKRDEWRNNDAEQKKMLHNYEVERKNQLKEKMASHHSSKKEGKGSFGAN